MSNLPIPEKLTADNLQAYVLGMYAKRENPDRRHTWDEVLTYFHWKEQNWAKASFELDISPNTYKRWYRIYNETTQ